MRNKKPRKSLFTWCIRTLAVSLVPSLLLISCASSDSSDTPDNTAPTASFTNVNDDVVGTSTFTLTFSEAVTGVSGQTASGACTANVQLINNDNTSICLPVSATANAANTVWTIDPTGDLGTDNYTLTLATTGIKDTAGNALDNGTSISFRVLDPYSTVLSELEADMSSENSAALVAYVVSTTKTNTSSYAGDNNTTNNLNAVIPAALTAALDAIDAYYTTNSNLNDNGKTLAIETAIASVLGNINGLSSLQLSEATGRSAASIDAAILSAAQSVYKLVGEVLGNRANDAATMGILMKGLTKSAKATGAADNQLGALLQAGVEGVTKAVVKGSSTLKVSLLDAMQKAVVQTASDPTFGVSAQTVAEIQTATAEGVSKGNTEAQAEGATGLSAEELESAKPDLNAPTYTIAAPLANATSASDTITVTLNDLTDSKGDKDNISVSVVATKAGVTADTKTLTQSDITSQSASVAFKLDDGEYTITVTATDQDENDNTTSVSGIKIDTQGPTVEISTPSTNSISGSTVTVTGTVIDNGLAGVGATSGITLSADNGTNSSSTVYDNGSYEGTITLPHGTNQTITVTGTDTYGTAGTPKTVVVTVDNVTPVLLTADVKGDVGGIDNESYDDDGTVTVTLTFSDNGSTVDYWGFSLDNQTPTSFSAVNGDNVSTTTTMTEGNNTVYFFVKDTGGNRSVSLSDSIIVDINGPIANDNNSLVLTDNGTDNNTAYANDLSILIDNVTGYGIDKGIGTITHYLFTDNVSYTPGDNASGWFSADNISSDNLSYTFTMNSSENSTLTLGDNLTLHLWAKDGLGKVSSAAIASGSLTWDNESPVNDNVSASVSYTDTNGVVQSGVYISSSGRHTILDTTVTFNENYSDNVSDVHGYFLTDNNNVSLTKDNFTKGVALTKSNLTKNTDNTLYLKVMDKAYNITTDTFKIYPDFQTAPTVRIDNATALVGGVSTTGDNGTAIVQIDNSDNQSVDITFSVTGANGGYAGYYIVLDNDTNLDTYQLNPSALDYSSSSLTYSFDDSNATNGQTLSFMIFSKTNSGKYPYSENSFTVVLKTEAGLIADNSTQYKVAISDYAVAGIDNGTRTYNDNGSFVIDSDSDGSVDLVDLSFAATSTLTPIDGFALSCIDTVGWFGVENNYTYKVSNGTATLDNGTNYSGNYTISGVSLAGLFGGSNCITEGNKNLYIAAITTGKTKSSTVGDSFEIDLTAPYIDNFTLHAADNSSKTDNLTDTKIGYTIVFSDNNTADTDNGSFVQYYQVTTSTTAPAWNDANWIAATNSDNVTDNYTFSSLSTFELYAWVKDNASLVSAYKFDNASTLSDSTVAVIKSITLYDTSSGSSTLTNDRDNTTVQIDAEDNESRITSYYIHTDNLTSDNLTALADSDWISFGDNTGNSVTENVTTNKLSGKSDGSQALYVWVKNTQDNISLMGTDNITLDTTDPIANSTPKLTGTSASTRAIQDNTTYTISTTLTLDNYTSWASDNGTGSVDNGSGVAYYYLSKDNTAPDGDNSTLWQAWDNLTLTLDNTSNGWNSVSTLTDNNSVGNKTIYLWIKDAANNVASVGGLSIFFDNETPDWTSDNFSLSSSYTNSATITIDNFTALDNESGVISSGVMGVFFTDNATYGASLLDNDSGWITATQGLNTGNFTMTLDNTTNGLKTIYAYIKDAAGNISENATRTIYFDNSTPVISSFDNGTISASNIKTGTTAMYDNISLTLYGNDNNSNLPDLDNGSSGWAYYSIDYKSIDVTDTVRRDFAGHSSTSWKAISGIGLASDNTSFDNLTFTFTFDNATVYKGDNLTIRIALKDNAGNESDNSSDINIIMPSTF